MFFIEKLSEVLKFNTLTFSAVVSVPVISVFVLFLSLGASAIINQIPLLKHYIV